MKLWYIARELLIKFRFLGTVPKHFIYAIFHVSPLLAFTSSQNWSATVWWLHCAYQYKLRAPIWDSQLPFPVHLSGHISDMKHGSSPWSTCIYVSGNDQCSFLVRNFLVIYEAYLKLMGYSIKYTGWLKSMGYIWIFNICHDQKVKALTLIRANTQGKLF